MMIKEFPYIFMGDSFFDLWRPLPFSYVSNMGVSGSRIEHQKAYIEQPNIRHEGLILNVGTNNIGQGDSVASTISTYSTFLDYAKTVFEDIYCVSVIPINPTKYLATFGNIKHYLNNSNAQVDNFNTALISLCQEKSVNYVNIVDDFSDNGIMNTLYTDDGIHPNTAGYSLFKNLLERQVPFLA